MGGSIAITLREPDGTQHRMIRWTNIMPHFICNRLMVQKDDDHIQDFMYLWRDMKEDWDRNHESGQFVNNMTDVYVPYDNACLYPHGYGLVVVDLEHGILLSMQGYTSLAKIYQVSIKLALRGGIMDGEDGLSDVKRLKAFYDAGKITHWRNVNVPAEHPLPDSFEELLQLVSDDVHANEFLNFELDLSPMVLEEYEESAEGCEALRDRVLELGFILSDAENAKWDEYIEMMGE